jgi:hypothetical protein
VYAFFILDYPFLILAYAFVILAHQNGLKAGKYMSGTRFFQIPLELCGFPLGKVHKRVRHLLYSGKLPRSSLPLGHVKRKHDGKLITNHLRAGVILRVP